MNGTHRSTTNIHMSLFRFVVVQYVSSIQNHLYFWTEGVEVINRTWMLCTIHVHNASMISLSHIGPFYYT